MYDPGHAHATRSGNDLYPQPTAMDNITEAYLRLGDTGLIPQDLGNRPDSWIQVHSDFCFWDADGSCHFQD